MRRNPVFSQMGKLRQTYRNLVRSENRVKERLNELRQDDAPQYLFTRIDKASEKRKRKNAKRKFDNNIKWEN